ncbi:MFS transporter [Chloroflexota bacterium]
MIKRRRFPKIFFGWWTAVTSGVVMGLGFGIHSYGFSVLFKPIASELGLTRAVTAVAGSISRIGGGFEAPLFGWLTDKFGPRWMVVSGIFVMGLGLILMNSINSLWAFLLVWGVIIAAGLNIASGIPSDTAITNWFVKKRGVAQGLRYTISGPLIASMLPIIAWLITIQDWRMTCVIFGLVMWFVALPLAWFSFKRHRPEYYGLLPDGATAREETADTSRMIEKGVRYATEVQEVEFTLRQAMKTPAYWLLMIAQYSQLTAHSVISMHTVPFLTDIGIAPIKAAAMYSMIFWSGVPLRLVSGFVADHVSKQRFRFLIGGAYLFQVAGLASILLNQTMPMIYTWLILYGISHGVIFPIRTIVTARYFGRKAFGSIRGVSMLFMMPIGMAAPVYAGWVYDTTGSYMTVFRLITALLAFAIVLMFLAQPPKPPAQITDIRKIL